MIGATATAQDARPGRTAARARLAAIGRDPVVLVIAAATAVGLALRLWQLSRPGYLLGVTEYDDGPYFGSAVRLVDGALPYRDFILVQPPGITLLMVPAALASKVAGTAWGMAAGRILTTLASTAGIALAGAAAVILGVCAAAGFAAEDALMPDVTPATIAAAARRIPPGSCVVTDEVSLLLLAGRFSAQTPGCSPVLDGLGTDLALSGGLKPATGAGRVPAVAAVWWQAFRYAQFAWLSRLNHRRIAWTPALRGYFRSHFTLVLTDRRGDALYRRTAHRHVTTAGAVAGPARAAARPRTTRATGERNAGNQRSGG